MTEEHDKALKLGAFFAQLAKNGQGVHPDLGHDDSSAEAQIKAYAPQRPTAAELAYNADGWHAL